MLVLVSCSPCIINVLGRNTWHNLHTVEFNLDDCCHARQVVQRRIQAGRPLKCVRLREGPEHEDKNEEEISEANDSDSESESGDEKKDELDEEAEPKWPGEEEQSDERWLENAETDIEWMKEHVTVEVLPSCMYADL